MVKPKTKKGLIAIKILEFLTEVGEMLPQPLESPYAWIRRAGSVQSLPYHRAVYRLRKQGMLDITKKNNKKFLKLTNKGQLRALLSLARLYKPQRWDGKWRLVMFDIPEQFRNQRDLLRLILKKQKFKKLQASVFISPHPINRAAINYLKTTGLINYIRMLRVDEADDEKELLHIFHLKP